MAGENSKEAKYRRQLQDQGVWSDAFEAAVHDLCILERRRSRAMAEWNDTVPKSDTGKRTGSPSITHPLHDKLLELEKEIARQRESLGLTAKGMRRLKPPEEKLDTTMEIRVVLGGLDTWAQ